MSDVEFLVKESERQFYFSGDVVSGSVKITIPEDTSLSDLELAFVCTGEVKWEERANPPYDPIEGYVCYDEHLFHEEVMHSIESEATIALDVDKKRVTIPFSFKIPKHMPSSMNCINGYVKYLIRLTVANQHQADNKFYKEIEVYSPIEKNLMITVSGSAEKLVFLHSGKVAMNASINRKGFAPGEFITVQLRIQNKCSIPVVPRISLRKVEIFMSGLGHKTVETMITDPPIKGSEIPPDGNVEERLDLFIPNAESFSVKSVVITVKYFVHITLDIRHSFDLHLNLPVILTSRNIIDQMVGEEKKKELAEMEATLAQTAL